MYSALQIRKMEVDGFQRGKRLPQCIFYALWDGENLNPTIHCEKISLLGTKKCHSITVVCAPGIVTYTLKVYSFLLEFTSKLAYCLH